MARPSVESFKCPNCLWCSWRPLEGDQALHNPETVVRTCLACGMNWVGFFVQDFWHYHDKIGQSQAELPELAIATGRDLDRWAAILKVDPRNVGAMFNGETDAQFRERLQRKVDLGGRWHSPTVTVDNQREWRREYLGEFREPEEPRLEPKRVYPALNPGRFNARYAQPEDWRRDAIAYMNSQFKKAMDPFVGRKNTPAARAEMERVAQQLIDELNDEGHAVVPLGVAVEIDADDPTKVLIAIDPAFGAEPIAEIDEDCPGGIIGRAACELGDSAVAKVKGIGRKDHWYGGNEE